MVAGTIPFVQGRRLVPWLVLVLLAAGCGDEPRALDFASRPDLHPPVLDVTTPAKRGLYFLAPKRDAEQRGVLLVDGGGEVVWFHPVSPEATDFRVQRYR